MLLGHSQIIVQFRSGLMGKTSIASWAKRRLPHRQKSTVETGYKLCTFLENRISARKNAPRKPGLPHVLLFEKPKNNSP